MQAQAPVLTAILQKQRSIQPLDLTTVGGESGLLQRSLGGHRGSAEFAPFLLRPTLQAGSPLHMLDL